MNGIKKKGNKRETIIVLEGDLGLVNCSDLKAKLIKEIEGFDSVLIDGVGITSLDITTVQLLIATRRELESQNKTMRMNLQLPENVETLLLHAGMTMNEI